MTVKASYGQILKASSIMGGAAGINLFLGMLRVKFAAVLIGPTGVGLIASFTSLQGFIGSVAGLGLQSSAVREISAAFAKGDEIAMGRAVLTLRRLCWLTGLIGMVAMILASPFLSQLTFGNGEFTLDIAALGVIILFSNLSGGQMALIQGMRRIGSMARANIFGAAIGTVAAIAFYTLLGLRGIIPSLVAVSVIQLAISFLFARRLPVPKVTMTLRETLTEARSMVGLGLVMMWSSLITSAVSFITVTLIINFEGAQAVGLYSAAFAMSGMFVNFVLSAMAADYYPRLTGTIHDKPEMVRMINEQSEIGLLLAVPGLIATMALAPWILQIFYTHEFLGAVNLLQWFLLGCLGRVVSWPLGFVMLSLGKGRWFLLTETIFNLLHISFVYLGLEIFGIEGVAVAFFLMYLCYTIAVHFVCRRLVRFNWSADCYQLVLRSFSVLGATLVAERMMPLLLGTLLGLFLTIIWGVFCLRGLVARVGSDHRFIRLIARLPGGKFLLFTH